MIKAGAYNVFVPNNKPSVQAVYTIVSRGYNIGHVSLSRAVVKGHLSQNICFVIARQADVGFALCKQTRQTSAIINEQIHIMSKHTNVHCVCHNKHYPVLC